MATTQGISFLHLFALGNPNPDNPGSNIISVTSQAAGDFDKSNLTSPSTRQRWRSTDAVTPQEIIIQAEQKSQIDTFALLGHNFTQDVIIEVTANIDNEFSAPPFKTTATFQEENIVIAQDFGDEFEFYKVKIIDPANPCGFVEVGKIIGGKAFTFTNNEDITQDFTLGFSDMAKTVKTEGFFRQSNENVKVRTLSAKFSKLLTIVGQNANFLGLRAMYQNVGKTRPFLTIVNREDPAFISLWGQLTSLPDESYTVNQFMSQSIKIEEVF